MFVKSLQKGEIRLGYKILNGRAATFTVRAGRLGLAWEVGFCLFSGIQKFLSPYNSRPTP